MKLLMPWLVIQKNRMGESSVYFISTKFLRQCGYGLTIIISPLLALMRNQIESAKIGAQYCNNKFIKY